MLPFRLPVALAFVAVGFSACAADIHPTVSPSMAASRMGELWERPTAVAAADLATRQWGAGKAPDAQDTYTFLRKKRQGNNPGLTVNDSQGREWHVKKGPEAQPEVVLSHVLSAIGYHQPPVYYLSTFTIADETGSH